MLFGNPIYSQTRSYVQLEMTHVYDILKSFQAFMNLRSFKIMKKAFSFTNIYATHNNTNKLN